MSRIHRRPAVALLASVAVASIVMVIAVPATAKSTAVKRASATPRAALTTTPASAKSAAAKRVSIMPRAALATARAAATGICSSASHPQLAARISARVTAALKGRAQSQVGLTVSDPGLDLTCKLHQGWHFDAASVIKVTIISALLLKEGGPSHLTTNQREQAWLMITQSDDDAATDLWNDVGMTDMQVFLDKAGMTHTELNYAWGLTEITAQDEMTLLQLLVNPGNVLSKQSRLYVLSLMDHVIAAQRWGVPDGAPSTVTVHVKNGWLPYPDSDMDADDWHVNSIGAFTGRDIDYEIVILTGPRGEQSEAYGIDTIQAAARVINRDLAAAG